MHITVNSAFLLSICLYRFDYSGSQKKQKREGKMFPFPTRACFCLVIFRPISPSLLRDEIRKCGPNGRQKEEWMLLKEKGK